MSTGLKKNDLWFLTIPNWINEKYDISKHQFLGKSDVAYVDDYDANRIGKHFIWFKHIGDPNANPNYKIYDGTVLDMIPDKWIPLINEGLVTVVVDTAEESWGPVYPNVITHVDSADVHILLEDNALRIGIDPAQVIWLTGDMNAQEYCKYTQCDVTVKSICQFLFSFPHLVEKKDFQYPKYEPDKFLICPNRFPKAHRGYTVSKLLEINEPMRISFPSEIENVPASTIVDCHFKLLDRKRSYTNLFDTKNLIDWQQQEQHFRKLHERMPLVIDDVDFNINDCAGEDAISSIHDYYHKSGFCLVTETWAEGHKLFLSDAILAPILNQIPFLVIGCRHTLRYLRSEGFETFNSIIDESYDDIKDDVERWEAVIQQVKLLSISDWQAKRDQVQEIVKHNFYHMFAIAPHKEQELIKWLYDF